MRSIEYLIQLYPEKTGGELLSIQQQDKEKDEAEYKAKNEKALVFIEDLNTNGGYYKGRFGSDQRFFYRFFDLKIIEGFIYCLVEHIVVFLGVKDGENIKIEKRTTEYKCIDKYGISIYERIERKEFDELVTYLNNVAKFWN